jgi:hypothetical protein
MHVSAVVEVNDCSPVQDGNIEGFIVLAYQPTVFVGD